MPTTLVPTPDNLSQALREMVAAFRQFGIVYALMGGIATSYRSRPRFTKDVDFLLDVPQLVLPGLLDHLHSRGFEFDTETVIMQWTREHMTVLSYQGLRIDWLKPVIPLYRHVLDAAPSEEWEGGVRIATPEGLILVKLLAFRPQDQLDIDSLLGTNQGRLDLDWIHSEWQTVFDLTDPKIVWFDERVREIYQP